MSNIPFHEPERHKCANLRKICQSRGGCWIFRIQGEDLTREGNSGGGVETPVGAMLWDKYIALLHVNILCIHS